jgi:hypothetical protein
MRITGRARRRLAAVTGALLLVGLAGCGVYSASSGRVDEAIQRVSVEYLENATAEPDLGVEIADLIILALKEDNTLKVVDAEASDSVIDGRVARYQLRQASISGEQQVDEYQVQIAVELSFRPRDGSDAIFERRRFTGTGNYFLNDPQGSSEQTAKEEAVEEIVRDVLAQVVEDW